MRLPRCLDLPGRMKRERRTTKAAHTGSSKSICLKSHNDALRGVRLVDNAGTLQRVPTRVGARLPGKQSVFGILGGIGTHPEDVAHMKHTADLHALPNANLAYSVYVVLHETTERITQELIDSRVMGLVRCGCGRAVILAHRPLARDSSRQQTLPLSSSFLVVGSFPRKTSENLKTKRCLVNYAWLRTKL
jgi:hypothetical protein